MVLLSIQEIGFLVFVGLMMMYATYALGYKRGWKNISQWMVLGNAEKKRINQLREGDEPVIVEGKVQETSKHGLIESPLTGEECVAYQYRIKEKIGDNWEVLDNGSDSVPFYLEEEYDSVYVEPSEARITMDRETESEDDVSSEKLQKTSIDFGSTNIPTGRRVKYTENEVESGQRGIVLGKVMETRSDATYRIGGTSNGQFIVSDTEIESTRKRLLIKGIVFSILGGFFFVASAGVTFILVSGYL